MLEILRKRERRPVAGVVGRAGCGVDLFDLQYESLRNFKDVGERFFLFGQEMTVVSHVTTEPWMPAGSQKLVACMVARYRGDGGRQCLLHIGPEYLPRLLEENQK